MTEKPREQTHAVHVIGRGHGDDSLRALAGSVSRIANSIKVRMLFPQSGGVGALRVCATTANHVKSLGTEPVANRVAGAAAGMRDLTSST